MSMSKARQLQAMVERTGLAKATIKDLMKHGWSYSEHLNQPATFTKAVPNLRRD